jgi:hypothetical protein
MQARLTGGQRGFGSCSTLGILDDDGRLVGGFVFHNWSPEAQTIEVTVASTTSRWLTREILRKVYSDYVFGLLECQMVIFRTSAENRHVRRATKAMGATEYLIKNGEGRGKDLSLLTLTDTDWYNSKFARDDDNGKTIRTRTNRPD